LVRHYYKLANFHIRSQNAIFYTIANTIASTIANQQQQQQQQRQKLY
jgi:hypothetical protein